MRRLFIFIILLLLSFRSGAQADAKLDSLEKALASASDKKTRIKLLNNLAREYLNKAPKKTISYSAEALKLARAAGDKKAMANALNAQGIAHKNIGNLDSALSCQDSAIALYTAINDSSGISRVHNNIGIIFKEKGEYDRSLEQYFKSLKLAEAMRDTNAIARTYGNIGVVYKHQGSELKALEYHSMSMEIYKKVGDTDGISRALNNMGIIYKNQKNYEKALKCFEEALKMNEEDGDLKGQATVHSSIGILLNLTNDHKRAMEHYTKALALNRQMGDRSGESNVLYNMGSLHVAMENYAEAKKLIEQSLELTWSTGVRELRHQCFLTLGKIYAATGNHREAYRYLNKYVSLKDSLLNESTSKQIAELQSLYDSEKKEKEIQLLKQRSEIQELAFSKQETELKRQRTLNYAVIAGLVLLGVFAFFMYNGYRQKLRMNSQLAQQNAVIEEKNKDILDSIRYAKRLQDTILPPHSLIRQHLPESFILYLPKDIVSGDFYYFETPCKDQPGAPVIIAAVDCTGHGVPGAFMSIVAHNLLSEAVTGNKISQPSLILDEVNKGLWEKVKQKQEASSTADGMDISICRLDRDANELQYAGAFSPLWIASNGVMKEVKADKITIGLKNSETRKFTNNTVQLHKGDTIYLFTDGFADQFGGEKGKKLMTKQFREILLSLQPLTMEEQKARLMNILTTWKGSHEQVDDILVIGLRV
jgi:tetratricopeptide (TPR) repeat protein/serine phosphatase RsbU (regulator of sigma subunit)